MPVLAFWTQQSHASGFLAVFEDCELGAAGLGSPKKLKTAGKVPLLFGGEFAEEHLAGFGADGFDPGALEEAGGIGEVGE